MNSYLKHTHWQYNSIVTFKTVHSYIFIDKRLASCISNVNTNSFSLGRLWMILKHFFLFLFFGFLSKFSAVNIDLQEKCLNYF